MNEKLICDFCGEEELNGYFNTFCFVVETKHNNHYVGIKKILEDLANYLMDKNCYLSASQILLLRPDIVVDFLKTIYPTETILTGYFQKYVICYECYEQYKELVPLA